MPKTDVVDVLDHSVYVEELQEQKNYNMHKYIGLMLKDRRLLAKYIKTRPRIHFLQ